MPRGIVRNELTFSYLDRGDLMSTLTCQAAVANVSEPAETSVSVDMNCKFFLYIYKLISNSNSCLLLFPHLCI